MDVTFQRLVLAIVVKRHYFVNIQTTTLREGDEMALYPAASTLAGFL